MIIKFISAIKKLFPLQIVDVMAQGTYIRWYLRNGFARKEKSFLFVMLKAFV